VTERGRASLLERSDALVVRAAARRYWPTCLALTIFASSWNGLGRVPHDDHRLFALRLFAPGAPAPLAERFHGDIALPLLARGLGATSPRAFFLLCLAIILLTLAGVAWRLRAIVERDIAVVAFALLLGHPVITVLLSWIGEPDALTFAATAVALVSSSPLAIGVAAAVGVANHTMAIASLSIVLAVRWAGGERITLAHVVALVAGLAAGSVVVGQFLAAQHLSAGSRFAFVTEIGFGYWIKQAIGALPFTLWAMHGGVWLALIACAWPLWHEHRRYVLAQAAATMVAFVAAFVSLDTTRIFALLAWAPAVHLILTAWRQAPPGEARTDLRRALVIAALVALAALRIFVWEGAVHASPFRNIPVRIFHLAGGPT